MSIGDSEAEEDLEDHCGLWHFALYRSAVRESTVRLRLGFLREVT